MNKQILLKMLEYSSIAYKDIQPNSKNTILLSISDTKSDVQYYIRKQNNSMYITFRGSNSCKDWLTNLKFCRKVIPYDNLSSKIRVHSGFIYAYKNINVRNKIQSLINEDINRVIVSGHSYGAALAILCAIDLEYNFPEKDYEVFLFGCPRVGNKAFKNSYDKRLYKTFRIDNSNDIVTKVPFAFLGYRHVGIKVHIGFPKVIGYFSLKQHTTQDYYSNILKSSI